MVSSLRSSKNEIRFKTSVNFFGEDDLQILTTISHKQKLNVVGKKREARLRQCVTYSHDACLWLSRLQLFTAISQS